MRIAVISENEVPQVSATSSTDRRSARMRRTSPAVSFGSIVILLNPRASLGVSLAWLRSRLVSDLLMPLGLLMICKDVVKALISLGKIDRHAL
jgi:hypothetical protein